MEKIISDFKSTFKTVLCFLIACLLLPFIVFSFVVVHYSNAVVNYVLSIKYPNLTISRSKKIRSLIDTPHNAGIFNFLLHVQGVPDFDRIRKYYENYLTNARDKNGYLKYPKLRQQLVTCWGHYAWVKDNSSFNLNNHILLNTLKYRGRAVNESNIQDVVSDLVRKYIPFDTPQWQVIIIPIVGAKSTTNQIDIMNVTELILQNDTNMIEDYYILIKIHHLIIAEQKNLHISEMLMLDDSQHQIYNKQIDERLKNRIWMDQTFRYFIEKTEHIQNLYQHFRKVIFNGWNKFTYKFESLETPDDVQAKRIINLTHLLSVMIIIIINALINIFYILNRSEKLETFRTNKKMENYSKFTRIHQLICHDFDRYSLSWETMKKALHHSLQPSYLFKWVFYSFLKIIFKGIILIPIHSYCELVALRELIFYGHTTLVTTYCGRLATHLPIIIYAQMEFIKIMWEIFKAPVNICEELFQYPSKETNILHMKSYSGRKIVSFSKTIDARRIRDRLKCISNHYLHESDFVMSCLAAAIHDYFNTYVDSARVPQILNTTCRLIAKDFFTDRSTNKTNIGGVVFLQLPLKVPSREHMDQIHSITENIRRKQMMIYLASIGQTKYDLITALLPRVFTKICINYFSFIFPVTITEIHGKNDDFQSRWGQKVNDVLLFRPPQSKTCLSLNIHHFGNKYRLAVMADTQLGPDHSQITRSFEKYMEMCTF